MQCTSNVRGERGFWPVRCIPWRWNGRVWCGRCWRLVWAAWERWYFIELGWPALAAHLDHALRLQQDVPYLPGVVVFIPEIDVLALKRPLTLRYHLYLTKELLSSKITSNIIPIIIITFSLALEVILMKKLRMFSRFYILSVFLVLSLDHMILHHF